MENVFKVGDTVILKSGGPVMTIYHCSDTVADCRYWNYATDVFENKKFLLSILESYPCRPVLAGIKTITNKK